MRFTFVHAADIHLDSPLRGLERYDGAPVEHLRGATRRAFENLVQFCLDEGVAFLLLAGDLYDGDWKDYNTGLFFSAQMSRLRAANIPVLLVRGNHDAESATTRVLKLPDNVHLFPSNHATTRVLEELQVAVHGRSYDKKAVTADLSATYPAAVSGAFNIGLLHTSADGRDGHADYAPCSVPRLVDKGYDYWALGHVHHREVLSERPRIVFCGNLQGRHIRETGSKGATVVTVDDGQLVSAEHRAFDVLRWAYCDVALEGASTPDEALSATRSELARLLQQAEGRPLAARVRWRGRTEAHRALATEAARWPHEIRQLANDLGRDNVWIEKVLIETRLPIDVDALRTRHDSLGELIRTLEEFRGSDAALAPLLAELRPLFDKLPGDVTSGLDALSFDRPETVRALLADVEQLLIPSLLSTGEPS